MENIAQGTLWQSERDSYALHALDAGWFFVALWRAGLAECDEMEGIAWSWQSIDGALTYTKNSVIHQLYLKTKAQEPIYHPLHLIWGISTELSSVALDNKGSLYSYTTVHVPSKNFKAPYTVGYVELSDGVGIFGQIRGKNDDPVSIGMPEKIVIDYLYKGPDGEDVSGYLFEPVTN